MKTKLNLKELQVKSFKIEEVKGGAHSLIEEIDSISPTACTPCGTDY